jgi:hypothetical protein
MAVVGDVKVKVKVEYEDNGDYVLERDGLRIAPSAPVYGDAIRRSCIIAGRKYAYAYRRGVFVEVRDGWLGLRDYTGPDYAQPVHAPAAGEGKVHGRELAWAMIDDVVRVPPPARKWEGVPQPAERLEDLMAEIRNPSVLPVTLTGDEISAIAALGPGDLRMVDGKVVWFGPGGAQAIIRDIDSRFAPAHGDGYIPLTDEQLAKAGAPLTPEEVHALVLRGDGLHAVKRHRYPQVPLKQQEPMPVESLVDEEQGIATPPWFTPDRLLGQPTVTLDDPRIVFTPRPGPGESQWSTVDEAHQDFAKVAAEAAASAAKFSATLRKAWVSYSFGGKVNGPTLVQHPDGRREMLGGTHENPWASRSTTLPDMVPAAVLARRPPAHIPTPTDLDDGLFLDAEPTGSIVRRS